MKTIYIYTLEHPITGEIRYVGKTVNPQKRKADHNSKAVQLLNHSVGLIKMGKTWNHITKNLLK